MPAERLALIRRRKTRSREDMFSKILQSSMASDNEHRAWRGHMTETKDEGIGW